MNLVLRYKLLAPGTNLAEEQLLKHSLYIVSVIRTIISMGCLIANA